MFLSHSVRHSAAVDVRFHCPACGERGADGIAWTEHQLTWLLGVVRILDERLHWVRGRCCERRLMCRVTPTALTGLDADAIESRALLKDRMSPVRVVLLAAAILFAPVPVLGPLWLLAAWWPSGSSRTWFRLTCRAVLIFHLIAMNLLVLLALLP